MHGLKRMWNALPSSIIHNFWSHTAIIQADCSKERKEFDAIMAANGAVLTNGITQLVPQHSQISIKALLNASGGEEYVKELTGADLIAQVLSCDVQSSDDEKLLLCYVNCHR